MTYVEHYKRPRFPLHSYMEVHPKRNVIVQKPGANISQLVRGMIVDAHLRSISLSSFFKPTMYLQSMEHQQINSSYSDINTHTAG